MTMVAGPKHVGNQNSGFGPIDAFRSMVDSFLGRSLLGIERIGAMAKLTLLLLVSTTAIPSFSQRAALQSVIRAELNVTDGSIETWNGHLLVNVPEMRAVLGTATPQLIEVHFTYLGPTEKASKLGNGEMRRQFGLKLKAQDPCNLLYVMWRTEPKANLAVSMKLNPGMQSSSQCRDGGYHSLKATKSGRLPELQPGSWHIHRAEINQQELQVSIDHEPMWEGTIPTEAMSFHGPVGLRSDNVRVLFDAQVRR